MGANLATLFKLRKPQRQPWDETLPDGTPAIDAATDSTDVQPARAKLLQFLRPVQPVPDETVSEQTPPDAPPTLAQRYGVTPDSGQSTDPLYKPVQPVPTIAQRFQVDPRQAAITKRDTLLADRNPKDTNGRGKSALKAMLDGAIAGLRTGGIGGALGGAAEGAIHGAAAPNLDERRTRNQEINRLSGGIALTDAENKRALEQEQGVAALNKANAETQEVLGRPEREAAKVRFDAQKEERVRAEVERHNRELEKYQGTSQEDSRKRAEETERHNRRMEEIGRMTAEATAGRFDTDRADKFDRDTYDDNVRQVTERNKAKKERYARAKEFHGKLVAALKEASDAAALVNNPPIHRSSANGEVKINPAEPEEVKGYQEKYDAAMERVNDAAANLGPYRDLVQDDPTRHWPQILLPEPDDEPLPERPVLKSRTSGGSAKQYVDAQAYAKDHNMSVEKARELIRANGHEPSN